MGNSNLLGAASKQFVQKQIKIRQENLSQKDNPYSTLTSQQIVQQNANTSYVALASSVNIENTPESKNYVSNPSIFPMDASTQQDLKDFSVAESTGVAGYADYELDANYKLILAEDAKLAAARNLPALDLTTATFFAEGLQAAFIPEGIFNNTDEDAIYSIYALIATEPRLAQVKEVYKSLESKTYENPQFMRMKDLMRKL